MSSRGLEFFKKKRPVTSKNPIVTIKREKYSKLADYSFLNKLKPRRINIDRERLYEENMSLKLKNNGLHEEIQKLRTKFSQVEKELSKKDDQNEYNQGIKPTHMINNLKTTIKELKSEIQQKNDEIYKLKKNMKSTRINEIELEVQAYIDECTRLRHHLEEIMKQRDAPQAIQGINDDKTMQQLFILNNLKKENQDLNQAIIQCNEEINKWRARVLELEKSKKKNIGKKGELSGLKSEIIKLKSQLDNASKDTSGKENNQKDEVSKIKKLLNESQGKNSHYEIKIKELNNNLEEQAKQLRSFIESNKSSSGKQGNKKKKYPPKFFQVLNEIIHLKNISIQSFIESLEKSLIAIDDADDLFSALESFSSKIKRKYIDEIVGILKCGDASTLKLKRIVEFYNDFIYDTQLNDSSSNNEQPISKNFQEQKLLIVDTPIADSVIHEFKAPSNRNEEIKLKQDEKIKEEQQIKEEKRKQAEKTKVEEVERQEEELKKEEEKFRKEEKLKQEEKLKNEAEEKVKEDKKKNLVLAEKNNEKSSTSKIDNKTFEEKNLEPHSKKVSKSKKKGKKRNEDSKSPPKKDFALTPELKSLLDHISFRMQINRIPKKNLFNTLFGTTPIEKTLSKTEMSSLLKKPPFSFKPDDIEALNSFLLDSPKATAKNIEEKLSKYTDNWEIFSTEDEEGFDNQLVQIISKSSSPLKESCKLYDNGNAGVISLDEFQSALKENSLQIPQRVFRYMLLLFYSHEMKLSQVPYKYFIKAYSEPSENDEESDDGEERNDANDEEKAKIVRHYLGIIAQILIQNKKSVIEIFECNENGIISPEDFIEGLKRIGLEDIEQEYIMLMFEALQYEDSREICVHIGELEEILMHYGVPPSKREKDEDESSEHNAKHYKRVSLLDSDNYELSDDDAPDKKPAKHSSQGISENSPFTHQKSFDGKASSIEPDEYQSDYED